MANKSKKRNKKYTGWDAAPAATPPTVHRVKAVQRSKSGQWVHEHKKPIRIWSILAAALTVLLLIISGLISLFV